MITKTDIEKMSVSDRLEAIEKIWESISSEYIKSPDWHRKILDSREEKVSSGKAKFLEMDEVKERLQRKADENSHHS